MNRTAWIVISACVIIAAVAVAQRRGAPDGSALPMARNDGEKRIIAVLDRMVRSRETYLSVPVSDGKLIRLLTEAAGAKAALEVGTSTGYSGLWFCLGLRNTGGHLTTLELDKNRAAQARKNFEEAGCQDTVTIIEGNAHDNVKRVPGPLDVVFIDADKEGYVDYLEKLLPLVRPGGLILAHNVDMARDYVAAVQRNPDLETVFYSDGNGMSVTLKKR